MSKITESARGRDCQIRIPGVCNHNNETTIPAHYSLATFSGRGTKSPDWMIAYACASCHAVCDGQIPRPNGVTRDEVRLAHAEGIFRTQRILFAEGLL